MPLKLYQPPRAFGLPCPSAFCVKLETYLRMADIPYELVNGEPSDAPKGKVPWIEDDGLSMGDSSFIVSHLKEKYGDTLDGRLTAAEHATGHAVQRMLEESLYFVSSYSKWVDDASFAIYSEALFGHMPAEQRESIQEMVRGKVVDKLKAQGVGRHQPDEVWSIGLQDVAAFESLLGDKTYLFGEEPTSFDASAYGVIGNIKNGPFPVPVRDAIQASATVAAYIDRISAKYFADLS